MLLQSIRTDFSRPTIHARNLFHVSAAMYDAWAAYDTIARPFLLGNTVGEFMCAYNGIQHVSDIQKAREESMSYAAYRLLKHRFAHSPGAPVALPAMDSLFLALGYDKEDTSTDYGSGSAAALGNYIAQCYISFGFQDGSHEAASPPYSNQYYVPVNPPLMPDGPGNPMIRDMNRWQSMNLDVFIDQSGNIIPLTEGQIPALTPEWGDVIPFSLDTSDLTIHHRDGNTYKVYLDPGPPPYLDILSQGGLSEVYKWGFMLVSVWSSHLKDHDTVMIDISPASQGNIPYASLPTKYEDYSKFYNLVEGGVADIGHTVNPHTGLPYAPNIVPRGDYARCLTEFWADGPHSETPPGHWFSILNYVSDHPMFEKRFHGEGLILDDLEWDVKAYFTLAAAMHDAAIACWGAKGWYDSIRPISAIRKMAEYGQSSDSTLSNYHPAGIPLLPGYIEVIDSNDALALRGDFIFGDEYAHVGKIKILAWRGDVREFIDPETQSAGVGWMRAENWWPYQKPTFVTPPFPGYYSGHSTYSRAAAEVMTLLTGDAYFPGGLGEFVLHKNVFLENEEGPSQDITLQWATYRDASDQTSLSRIWGGIHPPQDDIPGRRVGAIIGPKVFEKAMRYFKGL